MGVRESFYIICLYLIFLLSYVAYAMCCQRF